jgi:hypothetical protein
VTPGHQEYSSRVAGFAEEPRHPAYLSLGLNADPDLGALSRDLKVRNITIP